MSFSLRWLFIAVLFIAVCVVALLNANQYWASGARYVVFLVVPLGFVIAIASTGTTRMFWVGFTLVAAVQFLVLDSRHVAVGGFSLVEQGIGWLHSKIERDVTVEVPAEGYGALPGQMATQIVRLPYKDYFREVAHCVICAVFGLTGGIVAVYVYSRRDAPIDPCAAREPLGLLAP